MIEPSESSPEIIPVPLSQPDEITALIQARPAEDKNSQPKLKKIIDANGKSKFYYNYKKFGDFWQRRQTADRLNYAIYGVYFNDYMLWFLTYFFRGIDDFFAETTEGNITYLGLYFLVPFLAAALIPAFSSAAKNCFTRKKTRLESELKQYVEIDVSIYAPLIEAIEADSENPALRETLENEINKQLKDSKILAWQNFPYLLTRFIFTIAYVVALAFYSETKTGEQFIDRSPDINGALDTLYLVYSYMLEKLWNKCSSKTQKKVDNAASEPRERTLMPS